MPNGPQPASIPVRSLCAAALSLSLGACGSAASTEANSGNFSVDDNAMIEAAEANAAALAQDDDLANEAAADEAADMDVFGGNAAAGESGNSAPDLAADNDTAT